MLYNGTARPYRVREPQKDISMRFGPSVARHCLPPSSAPRPPDSRLRRRRLAAGTAGLAVLLAAAPAGAQVFELDATASTKLEAQDNVLRLPDGVEPGGDRSKSDFSHTYGLDVDAAANFGLQRLFVDGSVERTMYLENDLLDRTNSSVEGGLEWSVTTACDGVVKAGYSERQTDLSELLEIVSNTQTTASFRAEAGCRIAAYYRPEVAVFARKTENELESRALADVEERGVTGRFLYVRPEFSAAGVEVTYTQREYPNRERVDPSFTDDVTQIDTKLLLRRRLTGKAEAEFGVGASQLGGAIDAGPYVIYNAQLTWDITPILAMTANIGRAVSGSDVVVSDLRVDHFGIVDLTYTLSPKVDLTGEIAYFDRTYENYSPVVGDRTDQALELEFGAGWQAYDNIRLFAEYGYKTQDSNIERAQFDAHRVTTGLAISF